MNPNLSERELLSTIYIATSEYTNLVNKNFLFIGFKNNTSQYFYFECSFEKKHFMHLLGIKSNTLTAEEFYEKCNAYNNGIGAGLSISDCTGSREHTRSTINKKSSCCKELLCLLNARYMYISAKDKCTERVDFHYAYGNDNSMLGFKKISGTRMSVPVTLIPQKIDYYSSLKYKILFIYRKEFSDLHYTDILYEIKSGIFSEHISSFPNALRSKFL